MEQEEEKIEYCKECGSEVDKWGEGDICCFYSCNECPECHGRTCDHSC